MTERLEQKFLCAKGADTEIRAFIDVNGDLVVMWWDRHPTGGHWEADNGPKVPKEGLSGLAEFLLERLP